MVVARCTPSDCSELFRSLLLAVGLTAAAPVRADSWSEGRFPIAVFEGYTSHFGMRRAADGTLRPHNGLDIAAPLGSPVLSWWHGRVIETIVDDSCGIGVVIASGKYHHIYCLLRRQRLRRDQWVSAGQTGHWSGRPDRSHHRSASSLGNPSLRSLAGPCTDPQGHDPRPTGNRSCRPLIFRVNPDHLP